MNNVILSDLYRYEGDKNRSLLIQLKYIFFIPGFTYIYFFRKASGSSFILWKMLLRITMYITGIQIPIGTIIGKGFRIAHFGTIVINPDTVIGKNFDIAPGVVIGYSEGKRKGCPTIGNNVVVKANAVIAGNIKIGNDVLIAPGAFVNFDCPDNSIVIGNPGTILKRDTSPSNKYIGFFVNE